MDYFYTLLAILIGFLVELIIIAYLCNRDLNGKETLRFVGKFNLWLSEMAEIGLNMYTKVWTRL